MPIKNPSPACALLALFFAAHPLHAADINPADINTQEQMRQQERQQLLRQQQEIKPDLRDEMDALKQTPLKASIDIPENEAPCFAINKIALIGDEATKFQFALDEVLSHNITSANNAEAKPILGRCLGVQGINAVMNRVQNAIIAKGYVTTRVLAALQDLKAGLLQLTIIPGHVGALRFTPDSSKRITVGDLDNRGGTVQAAGTASLSINATGNIDNRVLNTVAGNIQAGAAATISASSLDNTQGQMTAGDTLTISTSSNSTALQNTQGLIASNQALTLNTASLNNSSGTVASVHDGVTITNQYLLKERLLDKTKIVICSDIDVCCQMVMNTMVNLGHVNIN